MKTFISHRASVTHNPYPTCHLTIYFCPVPWRDASPVSEACFGRRKKSAPCTNGSTLLHVPYVTQLRRRVSLHLGAPLFSTMQHFTFQIDRMIDDVLSLFFVLSLLSYSCLQSWCLGAVRYVISFSTPIPSTLRHTRQDKATIKARRQYTTCQGQPRNFGPSYNIIWRIVQDQNALSFFFPSLSSLSPPYKVNEPYCLSFCLCLASLIPR